MGRIIGYMANRKDRLGDVLDEEREAIAPPPGFRPDAWGIGFYQAGEVLHKKRPKLDDGPIDWEKVARGVLSDAVLIHFRKATVGDYRAENTHPFRTRDWLFAHNGTIHGFDAIKPRLLDSLPDFLRRNIRGSTDSEHAFAVLLSFLHDAGQLDRAEPDENAVRSAISTTAALIARHCAEVGAPEPTLNLMLTNGRTLYALRRGAPFYYAVRNALPSEGPPAKGAGAFRYVILCSNGAEAPVGYETLESNAILTVDRNLDVMIRAL